MGRKDSKQTVIPTSRWLNYFSMKRPRINNPVTGKKSTADYNLESLGLAVPWMRLPDQWFLEHWHRLSLCRVRLG
jgi:hypothetical protein